MKKIHFKKTILATLSLGLLSLPSLVYASNALYQDLPTSITEAANTSLQRTTNITYSTQFRLPSVITEPVTLSDGTQSTKTSNYTYDQYGNLTNLSISAPNNDGTGNSTTKNWQFTYNNLHQLTQITNPKGYTENYTYSSGGQVASVTNALNQVITLSNFNNYGSAQTISLPDSTTLYLTYDARGKVLTRSYQGSTVSFTYDNAQELTQITYPSGNYEQMIYDSAHRLTEVKQYDENAVYLGNITYTLDSMSNVKGITTYDATGTIIQSNTATYDTKNRLYKVIGSLNQTSTITYDPNSHVSQIVDGKNHNVNYTYDALNRLATMTAQDGGKTTFSYDAQDNITKITDPSNLNTNYTYDGFNNLIKQVSPDTGTTLYTYDLDDNIISQTDAKGQVSNYTYDSLDRLINVTYVGQSAEAVTLSYDSCTNGIGKICSITDKTGTINYGYDTNGRVSSKEYLNVSNVSQLRILLTKRKNKLIKIQATGLIDEIIQYGYNTAGQLTQMTYPSGMVVNYTYNNDNVVSMSYTINGTTQTLFNNGFYQPFNSDIASFSWGNGATYSKTFNLDGLISSITSANSLATNKSYVYDANYNVSNINDPVDSTQNVVASYDVVNRLNTYNYGSTVTHSYNFNSGYDLTSKVDNGLSTNFNYTTNTHQISSLNGAQTDSVLTDANGNITSSNGITYTYDAKERMNSSTDSNSNTTSYSVNYLGQRVEKSNATNTTYFAYSVNQSLIGEYDQSGNAQSEYIYLNGAPIGLVRNNTLYYVYDDHLGTPRTITDTNNNVVWQWTNTEAFGNNLPNDTISGTQFIFNLRLPGQYFDNETKLNYNLNRDYNPNWGRYVQSDPIGLSGGINTYGYSLGNSIFNFDNDGLEVGNLFQRGYPTPRSDLNLIEFWVKQQHWYETKQIVCYRSNPECTLSKVNELIRRYPAPKGICILNPNANSCSYQNNKEIINNMINYAWPVGNVKEHVFNNCIINDTTPSHYLSDGSVMRSAVQNGDAILVDTLGYGNGKAAYYNELLANILWNRVNSPIINYFNKN